jgi:hypothetical protein
MLLCFCGAAAKLRARVTVCWCSYISLSRSVSLSHTHTHTHCRTPPNEWPARRIGHYQYTAHKKTKKGNSIAHIWIQTHDPTKETDAALRINPVSYRDGCSQYGILSLHLCWLTNVIESWYVEMVERQKALHNERFWLQSTEIIQ